ncbi:MAG: A/G-specific adenine glycosylase [Burkholderiales bacterium]
MRNFAAALIRWQKRHGRHHLPWQNTRDPYRVWLSEIMLQQTQVTTVIPYYRRFLQRFPDLKSLARAGLNEVLILWSGLGYYARARNLQRAAQIICARHGGRFPRAFDDILNLPGIGRSTAGAIGVFAFGARRAILDGNVKRVLTRCFGIAGYPGEKKIEAKLWRRSEALLPARQIESYTQALMDVGATVCLRRKPLCAQCPLKSSCIAFKQNRIAQLPAPKPKKLVPRKYCHMLILLNKKEVLLERRAPAGIWASLWSFPEIEAPDEAGKFCARRFGARVSKAQFLPRLEHGFSHFQLSIQPLLLPVEALNLQAREPGQMWLNLEDAQGAAVPAPVRKLLRQVSLLAHKER